MGAMMGPGMNGGPMMGPGMMGPGMNGGPMMGPGMMGSGYERRTHDGSAKNVAQ